MGHIATMQQATGLTPVSGGGNRRLDGHRQPEERAPRAAGVFQRAGLCTHAIGVEIDEKFLEAHPVIEGPGYV